MRLVVSGTDTGVGKTVAAAMLTQALGATYFKPVQSGLEDETDTDAVRRLTGLPDSHFLPEIYRLRTPASPHISAEIDGGNMYGRGAVDMKGAIACFVAAVARYLETHGRPSGSISLMITGDEEGPAVNGTEKLLRWADTAMQYAKMNFATTAVLFDERMQSKAVEKLRLENDLQRAIDQQQLYLNYQPIVSLATGKINCVEALVRCYLIKKQA